VRTLIADSLAVEMSHFIELFGDALNMNTKLEGLSIRENKIRQS
jgi:hypothetical protein